MICANKEKNAVYCLAASHFVQELHGSQHSAGSARAVCARRI